MTAGSEGLGWLAIARLGLVQSALGAIVVLTTSTLNRIMVVELALPAVLPGALVALHYGVQIARPRFGYGSDGAGRRSRWIVGGMAVLCLGALGAALAVALMARSPALGVAAAVAAFIAIGAGVGASGTALIALLAKRVAPERRGAAAAVTWILMIAGIIVTAGVAGAWLSPFSMHRLIVVSASVSGFALALTVIAVWGIENGPALDTARANDAPPDFKTVLGAAWADPVARRFTVFVFVSMLAYSMQDLILEPFAGLVFDLAPGQSTQLTGVQHGGVLLGMLGVGALASGVVVPRVGRLTQWATAGCVVSALALLGLIGAAASGPPWPLRASVFVLGTANGGFAVAAIALMMSLAGRGENGSEGTRVGLWGAAQAIAFGAGGLVGTGGVDGVRALMASTAWSYGVVFAAQAVLFLVAARLMLSIGHMSQETGRGAPVRSPAPGRSNERITTDG